MRSFIRMKNKKKLLQVPSSITSCSEKIYRLEITRKERNGIFNIGSSVQLDLIV